LGPAVTDEGQNVPAIRVRGLTKRFGLRAALDRIDLDVARGEFLTLFGPNGAGKTTLIRCLATLSHASAGRVEILDQPVQTAEASLRCKVGVVSHSSFLYGALTARENLTFYARMFGVEGAETRVIAVARDVGLEDRLDDPVRTFSRGLTQRCSIARALVHDPEILLFDEPFSGLDPVAAATLHGILREAHAAGRTVLMTSHDLRRGRELADRFLILRSGRIAHDAPSAEIGWEELEALYDRLSRGRPR
jgi:heme exporter protein A